MKFVHITSARNVPAIRRHGIQVGTCGFTGVKKGVYCVPLVTIPAETPGREEIDGEYPLYEIERRSSLTYWRWLNVRRHVKDRASSHQSVAIIFELNDRYFPILMTVVNDPGPTGPAITQFIEEVCGKKVRRDWADIPYWERKEILEGRALSEHSYIMDVPVPSLAAYGHLLSLIMRNGPVTTCHDDFQTMVPQRVRPEAIVKIIPLYEGNKRSREKRRQRSERRRLRRQEEFGAPERGSLH